ncbi:MAG: helicase [Paramuribaculum sp.]|nr:helicase [Paramuribaculum sp.]
MKAPDYEAPFPTRPVSKTTDYEELLSEVERHDVDEEEELLEQYARVGTTWYRTVEKPMANGTFNRCRVVWNAATIKADHGTKFLNRIPRYSCFCSVPNHIDYQRVVGNALNLYEPITHQPVSCNWDAIETLLRHIFEEHYEYGLDYIQLLYQKPVQKLPILLLVSEQRNTGKTTFLNFLKAIFQDNATFNTNEDFRSQFNSDWAGKLLIMVDEVLLSRREDSERLKNLSTTRTYKAEAKGKDRSEVEFFGKFVLCSNNENHPVLIDPEEVRYWVRKIKPLQSDDPHFLDKITEQIPAFLYFLMQRQLSVECENRMWFSPARLRTAALDKIILSNRSQLQVELADLFVNIMDYTGKDTVSFVIGDIIPLLNFRSVRAERSEVRRVLQTFWHLKPADNTLTYQQYSLGIPPQKYCSKTATGRYYTISKDFLISLSLI